MGISERKAMKSPKIINFEKEQNIIKVSYEISLVLAAISAGLLCQESIDALLRYRKLKHAEEPPASR
ncbi:MAG: hypothetical protein JW837_18095 [Sedimentisphaerales bacterium]|nr:hypothetical protein [Sedimentisphaerales bacterium]